MTKLTYKRIQTFNAMITLLVLFASFYFQYVVGLTPCPLCIMQRICVFGLLAVMSLNFRTIKRAYWISVLQIILAFLGAIFAFRQLWLQSLPAGHAPACMPGLDIMIRYFPWKTVLQTLLWGSGDCAETTWRLLGISMAGWSAMYFIFMFLAGCVVFGYTRRTRFEV